MQHHTDSEIRVTNLIDGDVLTYPLAILRGTTCANDRFIHISTSSPSTCMYPVVDSHFTALYELKEGPNEIRLARTSAALGTSSAHTLTLCYMPPSFSSPFVRLVYLLTADSDGSIQSPDPPEHRDLNAGKSRLKTAGLMIQAATAEMMAAHGFQRRTFALAPSVLVHRLSNLPLSRALEMSGMDLWHEAAASLSHLPNRENSIDVAVMSFSRLLDGNVRAHTALGGGPLALFGGASLFCWPANTSEIPKRLRDCRKFNPRQLFDDSAGRANQLGRRACTATTIGALLHELGHCLSLPHPTGNAAKDGGGIMARGFDYFDRLFVEPEKDEPLPFWDRGSAIRLRFHRFLQFEDEVTIRGLRALSVRSATIATAAPTPAPEVQGSVLTAPSFSKLTDGSVVCRSSAGIGHIAYYKNGDNAAHEEVFDSEPTEFRTPPLSEIRRRCKAKHGDKIVLSAIDVNGMITDTPYDLL